MSEATLSQIEDAINQLAIGDQLLLIERIAHRLSISDLQQQRLLESQLMAMATDPEIQHELQQIDMEFTFALDDGLDTD